MTTLVIAGIAVGVGTAGLLVWGLVRRNKEETEEQKYRLSGPNQSAGLDGPLFESSDYSTRRPVVSLTKGMKVTAITPLGPLDVECIEVSRDGQLATLKTSTYTLRAYFDEKYLSERMSDELGIPQAAWRVEDIAVGADAWYSKGRAPFMYSSFDAGRNKEFLLGTVFNTPLMEQDVMYNLIFVGFDDEPEIYAQMAMDTVDETTDEVRAA